MFLQPSAHFKQHHPAFSLARGFSSQCSNHVIVSAQAASIPPVTHAVFEEPCSGHHYMELDIASIRADLSAGGASVQDNDNEGADGEWCEELVMDEQWAHHFLSKKPNSKRRQIAVVVEEEVATEMCVGEKHSVKSKSTKKSASNRKNPVASAPLVKPWRKIRYSDERLKEVRQLENDIKHIAMKHVRHWPAYPECEMNSAPQSMK
jgi:hypothetical protein